MKFILILITLLMSSSIFANPSHVGMVVKKQGKVELLTKPSNKMEGKGPHVLFQGKYYTQTKIRLGTKLTNGAILRTGKSSKVKVVYRNGDQINVGEGTAYQVSWSNKKIKNQDDPGAISLMYGSIRGVINKKGPRSGIRIKTKQAVMGIRGTDFYIGQRGTSGKSVLSVLRGKVQLRDKKNLKKKIAVAQGFSAEIDGKIKLNENKRNSQSYQVAKTTRKELIEIQKNSDIKQDKNELKQTSKKIKKVISQLEKRAIENTLDDIKGYDLKFYKNLKAKNIKDVDKINKVVVGKVFEKAPTKKAKIGIDEDELEEDAYKKYFKVD